MKTIPAIQIIYNRVFKTVRLATNAGATVLGMHQDQSGGFPLTKFCLMAIIIAIGGREAAAEDGTLNVGNRRQVFVDGRFLRSVSGVELVVHRPVKTGDTTIGPEHPWERSINAYNTIIKDGDTYHAWYDAVAPRHASAGAGKPVVQRGSYRSVAYARSQDGIRWEKPMLGLAEVFGSRQNNIVLGYGAGGVQGEIQCSSVFIDPNAPPAERFRLLAGVKEMPRSLQLFSSADGIHWKLTHPNIVVTKSVQHHLDSQNLILWDDRINRYVAYTRRNLRPAGSQGRVVSRSESATLGSFAHGEVAPVVLAPDRLDPHYYDPAQNRYIPIMDFYTHPVIKYPWAEDAYYMFPSTYYSYHSRFHYEFKDAERYDFQEDGQPRANIGPIDGRFLASRDGIAWHRYDRRPFLQLGMAGESDSKQIFTALGLVPALNGREMYLYYSATDRLHGYGFNPQSQSIDDAGLGPSENQQILTRAVMRRDGFISVRAAYTGGEFTTPLLQFSGVELVLNINTSAVGTVRVEILDQMGSPIDGYRLQDCARIHTANEINRVVSWNGRRDVSPLAGQPVRLRFVMHDADLYALQFR